MKLSALKPVLLTTAFLLPWTGSSQDTAPPAQLHTVAIGGPDRAKIGLSADSIVKEDGRTGGYASVIHLKGNVQIRTCCAQLPPQQQAKPRKSSPARAYIIMTADEADYDGETGNIEARGTVHLSFQNVSPKK